MLFIIRIKGNHMGIHGNQKRIIDHRIQNRTLFNIGKFQRKGTECCHLGCFVAVFKKTPARQIMILLNRVYTGLFFFFCRIFIG